MSDTSSVAICDADDISSQPVFIGTRVPVTQLFDYLARGESLTAFVEDFPNVAREQAVAAIQEAGLMWARHTRVTEITQTQIDTFLEEVYRLATTDHDGAIDKVFDFIDRLLCDGRFGVCDQILLKVDVERLTTSLMRSFLAITDAAKDKLPARKELYVKIEAKMTALRGPEKTRRILGNLA